MGEVFGWLQAVIEWLGLFIPRRLIVRKINRLVKYKWDGSVEEVGPGLRWYWPITTEIEEITVVRQPLDINIIQFVTMDNKSCAADCAVTYYITDAIVFLTENYDGHLALSECVSAALCKKLRSMDFKAIQHSEIIDAELTEIVSVDCEPFGVEIEYVRLNRFLPIIGISLVNDKPTAINNIPVSQ